MVNNEKFMGGLRWYVVQTKPKEEDRADFNLRAWNVETLAPKIKARRVNEFTNRPTFITKPLFPGYIFAHFDATTSLHDINGTRGIRRVVRFGDVLVPVDEQVIDLIRLRMDKDCFVQIGEEILPGNKFTIRDGPLSGLVGVLEREMKDNERVMLLLNCVSYQGHFSVERDRLRIAS